MNPFESSSYLSADSADYIDALYEAYLDDPNQVEPHWRAYFSSLPKINGTEDVSHAAIRDAFREMAAGPRIATAHVSSTVSGSKQFAVNALIAAYRRFGHLNANINPLDSNIIPDVRLQLSYYGLSDADLNETFDAQKLISGQATLKTIITTLKTHLLF